ncbi:CDP-diacylglycerol--glycerol-3-phosphate 3-phosphatidyltransferase [Candidatus Woesearchaeota archaeon]|nr:CDP-diacylglycerol--glycerol-3-phosphate 3-phosphatidyltransferase [Candidatus Woesearchaeota archaeon]
MVKKDRAVLNLANSLTIARMLLAPVFSALIFMEMYISAFIVILIATLTDFLDGHIARIWKMQTRLGKMLDPLADKVIISFAIITLLVKLDFPLWAGIPIILRDIILFSGGLVYLSKNRKKVLKPNLLGKITTFFQMSAIVVYVVNINDIIKNGLLVLTLAFTFISAYVYFIKGYRLFFTKKKKRVNLPNKITIFRILAIPVFIAFLLSSFEYKNIVATVLFIIIALSDALDGYIARKRYQVTSFGKLVDPLADKLLVSSALIFLIGKGIQPWIAYVIIAREFAVTGIRMIALTKNYTIPAKLSGKVKTVTQIIAITAVLLKLSFGYHLMIIAVIITIYSGIEYIWYARHFFKELA